MPVASLFRPQPQLLQPEFIQTSVVKGAFKTTQSKPRRRVRFNQSVSVRPVLHVNNMSDDEIADAWYNRHECADIKRSMAVTIKMMSAGVLKVDDDEHCSRGLEHRTRPGSAQRRENKMIALDAVLDEQDRQQACGVVNDEAIRKVFVQENLHCRLAALEKGVADQDEARNLDEQDEDVDSDDDYSSADEMDYRVTLDNESPRNRYTSSSWDRSEE